MKPEPCLLHQIRIVLALFVVSLMTPACVYAQHAEEHGHVELTSDPELTTADVVSAALQNHPNWVENSARTNQAEAWSVIARGFTSGQAVIALDYLDDRLTDDIGEQEVQASVELPLWWPGQRKSAGALADSMMTETELWVRELAWSVAGNVRELIAEISLAEAELEIAHATLESAEELLDVTEAREQAGDASRQDVMMVKAKEIEARTAELEADARVVDARREYAVYTGLNRVPATVLAEEMTADADISLNHPLLASIAAKRDRARQQTEQEKLSSRGNPTLSLGARRQRGDRLTENNTALAMGISIPIGGSRFTDAAVADSMRAETEIEVELLAEKRRLERELHEVEHDMRVNAQSLLLAEENAQISETNWTMARTGWELGEVTMTEVIIALQQYRAAQLHLATMEIQQKALVSAFNQTLGVMP